MLLPCVSRLPWQWTWLLFATAATATISPSNSSTVAGGQYPGTLPLQHADGDQAPIADLVALTKAADQTTITGNLYKTSFDNAANITDGAIALISCNPGDYPSLVGPERVFQDAYRSAQIAGVILYSTATDYCDYAQDSNQQMLQDFAVLSMTNKTASALLLDALNQLSAGTRYLVRATGRDNGNSSAGSFIPQSPLGPSPSTAVAMIILYSITGIITALFLVIIVTGAVRAHRHPERYGPRHVLGRPRQSRARGLGRAILDTIPIVKFGEKEVAKPADVELASTAETSDTAGVDGPGAQTATVIAATNNHAARDSNDTPNATDTAQPRVTVPTQEHQEGIAPAQPAIAAATAIGQDGSSNDEHLGCSICTEDFERGQDLRVLPCDHKFHPECVDPWLLNVSGTCPLCRVDLRPVSSHESSHDPDEADPPLNPEAESSQRHRSAFRDILSLRHRPNATPQERIYYLRRLREQQRRTRSADAADNGTTASGSNDVAEGSRTKRMSARLSGVFGGRTRRERSPTLQGESSRSGAQPSLPDGQMPALDGVDGTTERRP